MFPIFSKEQFNKSKRGKTSILFKFNNYVVSVSTFMIIGELETTK